MAIGEASARWRSGSARSSRCSRKGSARTGLGLFIRWCAALAAIFIPIFLLIEWYREDPFANLRLLRYRNLWVGSVVTSGMDFALYGSGYLLLLYLPVGPGATMPTKRTLRCSGGASAVAHLPFRSFPHEEVRPAHACLFRCDRLWSELLHEYQYITRLLRARLFLAEYRALVRLTVYDRAALGARDLDV